MVVTSYGRNKNLDDEINLKTKRRPILASTTASRLLKKCVVKLREHRVTSIEKSDMVDKSVMLVIKPQGGAELLNILAVVDNICAVVFLKQLLFQFQHLHNHHTLEVINNNNKFVFSTKYSIFE